MNKILVIEDVHYLRSDIVEILKYEGYDVRGAENGRVGIEVAQEFIPDLIVCDIMMPEMNGYDVLKTLRADPQMTMIPFIFLTAKTDRSDIREGMNQGAEDYLTKPFLSSELLGTIRARLERVDKFSEATRAKLDQLRNNISTALPHELRTPLNTILGFSDMMTMEAGQLQPEQVQEWAQHINNAAMRLYRLVENYLTYVRVEMTIRDPQRMENTRKKRTEDAAAVVEFQSMTRAHQAEREGDLQLNIAPTSALAIGEADLNKIVDEVLDNAFKFSKPGQPVIVETQADAECYTLRFRDQGVGMTQEQIDSIGAYMQFERFIREQQGAGLGLVIVRQLAHIHGGSMSIESQPEQGTTVIVQLPYANG